MAANTRKQLNIRSTEAYETAHRLAKRLGKTTQQVVIEAIEEKARRLSDDDAELPPDVVAENLRLLDEAVAKLQLSRGKPLHDLADDDWLYDENGAPH
jgi:hypothetical protein